MLLRCRSLKKNPHIPYSPEKLVHVVIIHPPVHIHTPKAVRFSLYLLGATPLMTSLCFETPSYLGSFLALPALGSRRSRGSLKSGKKMIIIIISARAYSFTHPCTGKIHSSAFIYTHTSESIRGENRKVKIKYKASLFELISQFCIRKRSKRSYCL